VDYTNPPDWLVKVERVVNNRLWSLSYGSYVRSLRLKGSERVLDFGSGSGAAAIHLARALSAGGGRLTCLDISEKWLECVRVELAAFSNVDFVLGDIFSGALESGVYDVVFVHFVLHDIAPAARAEVVKALAARLKPDGQIYLREPLRMGFGLQPEEVRLHMQDAGLGQESFRLEKVFLKDSFRAVYARQKTLQEQMEEFAQGGMRP